MNKIGNIGKKTVKSELDTLVYKAYKPSTYVRTKQLKNSVTSDVYQVGGFTSAVIFHDTNMIDGVPRQYKNNYTGQHYSTGNYYIGDYSYFVPATVNDGTSGHIFGTGKWTEPRPYFTNAKNYMEENFRTLLKEDLVRQGLKIE